MTLKNLSAKAVCNCSYHTCLYLYWLYLKLTVFYELSSKYPYKYPKCWNFERPWPGKLKITYRLVLFIVKLLNWLLPSCLWKNSGARCFLLLSFFFHSKHNLKWYQKNLKIRILVLLVWIKQTFLKLSPNIVRKLSPNIVKNHYLMPSGNPQSCP